MSSVSRLYVASPLAAGDLVNLDDNQSKYLMRVMRLGEGDEVRIFNGTDGEWSAKLVPHSAKKASLEPVRQTREQVGTPDLTLFFAPLKKARTDFVVEKACELGVRQIQPVMTEFTQSSRVRSDRLQSVVIEAAEQTERMDVPKVQDDRPLHAALDDWPTGKPLYYCDEAGDAKPFARVLESSESRSAGILIGPEGGFSPKERERLRSLDFVVPVTLGPRILRAETAAVSALTLWQSIVGDWQEHPYLPESEQG
ncbi:16S rRNA (uracil(1498)-N(3))-methyltransferase [Henriciella litoralis]|uniref:16S rRNA (uracil(1498)-N(3))-methyltransferase n=1 Tax=Henriciella litoralis TaxID=568102 RepID=UPI00146E7273|nr:16S rRNA (uracil(1498)-N(3))-methyltransferase [Henriciella litoralis]